jgi:hypothetical protein
MLLAMGLAPSSKRAQLITARRSCQLACQHPPIVL